MDSTLPARVARFGDDAILTMRELALYLGYEKGKRPEDSARAWAIRHGVRLGKRGPFNVVEFRAVKAVVFNGTSDLVERAQAVAAAARTGRGRRAPAASRELHRPNGRESKSAAASRGARVSEGAKS